MTAVARDALEKRIDAVLERARAVNDPETQADLAKYICVLACGYIEESVRLILNEYAMNRSDENVARYVARRLRRFQNPNSEKLLTLASDFSADWHSKLNGYLQDQYKGSVDTIAANRNQIAHGANVGITLNQISGHLRNARAVVQFIAELCA